MQREAFLAGPDAIGSEQLQEGPGSPKELRAAWTLLLTLKKQAARNLTVTGDDSCQQSAETWKQTFPCQASIQHSSQQTP